MGGYVKDQADGHAIQRRGSVRSHASATLTHLYNYLVRRLRLTLNAGGFLEEGLGWTSVMRLVPIIFLCTCIFHSIQSLYVSVIAERSACGGNGFKGGIVAWAYIRFPHSQHQRISRPVGPLSDPLSNAIADDLQLMWVPLPVQGNYAALLRSFYGGGLALQSGMVSPVEIAI